MAAQSKEDAKSARSTPSSSQSQAPSKPSAGLTSSQKYALIGGAAVLVVVLGLALFSSPGDDPKAFANYQYQNTQLGIIQDLRGVPSGSNASSKIIQCGVNLIISDFYAGTSKDLVVYTCDNVQCEGGEVPKANASANSTKMENISYADALNNMSGRAYFNIQYGDRPHYVFHPTYADVFISPASDPSLCSIGVQAGSNSTG